MKLVRLAGALILLISFLSLLHFTNADDIIAENMRYTSASLTAYKVFPMSVASPDQKISDELEEVMEENKGKEIPVVVVLSAPPEMAVAQQMAVIPTLQAVGFQVTSKQTDVSNTVSGLATPEEIQKMAQDPYIDKILYDGYYFQVFDEYGTYTDYNPKEQLNISYAWSQGYRGQGVTVIIIDSGIKRDHPALMRDGRSLELKQISYGTTEDYTGVHGTHVAGIIASQDPRHLGVAPDITGFIDILALPDGTGKLSWILSALDEAYKEAKRINGPVIISCSWGGDPNSEAASIVRKAAIKLTEVAVVVFAAGNFGPKSGTVASPGDASMGGEDIITVGAVDSNNKVAEFSARGPGKGGDAYEPDFVAPGVNIVSTSPDGFVSLSGTSMATPFVSGLAAIVVSKNPSYSHDDVYSVLMQSSVDLGPKGFDYSYGYGLPRADKALNATPSEVTVTSVYISDDTGVAMSLFGIVLGSCMVVYGGGRYGK